MKNKALTLTLSAIVLLVMAGSAWGQLGRPSETNVPSIWGTECQTQWIGGRWQPCASRPCAVSSNLPATFCVTAPRTTLQCGLRRGELWRSGDMVPLAWHDCWSSEQCCYTYNFVAEQGRSYFIKAQNESPFHECGPTKSKLRPGTSQCTPD
ncbi:MAG: hypothetical protein V1784_01660 [bacterium]